MLIDSTTSSFSLPGGELLFLASDHNLYDYAHLYGFALELHRYLEQVNADTESPVAILSESRDSMVFLIAACFLLHRTFVVFNPGSADRTLNKQLDRVNPSVLFTCPTCHKRSLNRASTPIPEKWMERTADSSMLPEPEKNDRPFAFFFTSGTTGTPKIVPLNRRQVITASRASAQNFKPGSNRFWLLCLPFHHIGGVSIILRSLIYHSATYRMDEFDAAKVRTFLSENPLFEVASLVPTMLHRLLEDPIFQVHKQFKAMLLGGGRIPDSLIDRAITRGVPIVTSYGMTETCAQIAANPMLKPSGMYIPKKSVGPLFAPNRAQIRDVETGKILRQNEMGALWIKGPQVFDGYLDEELNQHSFDADGWFNTGDMARINMHNQLFIETRRTDRIVTGGENVDPIEIEQFLESLDTVAEAAVVGIHDDTWGQKVVAFIVQRNGTGDDTNKLQKQCKASLEPHQVPKAFLLVKKLPRTSTRKLKRKTLEKQAASALN